MAVLRAAREPGTAREIAARLQLSMRDATVAISRLRDRDAPLLEVVETKRVEGVTQPVMVYKAVDVDAQPKTTILQALNHVIAQRRARLDEGA
jgi:hypothetical protein